MTAWPAFHVVLAEGGGREMLSFFLEGGGRLMLLARAPGKDGPSNISALKGEKGILKVALSPV